MTEHTETRPPVLVSVDEHGGVTLPDELWRTSCLATHDRFDLVELDAGALLLRPCSLSEDEFRRLGPGHRDADWTEGSWCGLTKWTCAGCGESSIVEHLDRFPAGWIELAQLDAHCTHSASAVVCPRRCLAAFAASDTELTPTHLPGFPPRADDDADSAADAPDGAAPSPTP
jgi:hypothetical protein